MRRGDNSKRQSVGSPAFTKYVGCLGCNLR